jgi:hypothetical protein
MQKTRKGATPTTIAAQVFQAKKMPALMAGNDYLRDAR